MLSKILNLCVLMMLANAFVAIESHRSGYVSVDSHSAPQQSSQLVALPDHQVAAESVTDSDQPSSDLDQYMVGTHLLRTAFLPAYSVEFQATAHAAGTVALPQSRAPPVYS